MKFDLLGTCTRSTARLRTETPAVTSRPPMLKTVTVKSSKQSICAEWEGHMSDGGHILAVTVIAYIGL